ncbi:MAG: hypothetical protein KIG18_00810 [Candidatus Methanomethylophilaceae archaeon]|uniref:hypothetical protein n=1 Tax=Candidatus Methanarcanum hacksteinii TaxID=2911857 RepID=UPI0015A7FDEB|nr:hypothetical protein [Candidatus Methanomethylophilaceae archaeon]MCI6024484.1 hypothetical protein [Methanomassiliicoccales archaeon]MDY4580015.1 hypothetical protein [Candidatus Methanarcanum hacksteinii]TQS77742.1 MAG: hypothetical protein A3204_01100 [Candidatus Methanarcanum hacksteinii]
MIGDWLYGVFGPYGYIGILVFIFLLFYIDSLIFPTLPEVFFILSFMYDPTPYWGMILLLVGAVAEFAGVTSLYLVVERIRVPERIRSVADKYSKFLILNDERMILVNRVAPVMPFTGAFISLIESWEIKRAWFYLILGYVLKYGAILLFANFFFAFFSGPQAEVLSIVMIIIVMAVSLFMAYRKKKREGLSQ